MTISPMTASCVLNANGPDQPFTKSELSRSPSYLELRHWRCSRRQNLVGAVSSRSPQHRGAPHVAAAANATLDTNFTLREHAAAPPSGETPRSRGGSQPDAEAITGEFPRSMGSPFGVPG